MAMKAYREEMRACGSENLSIPQFRILAHLWRGLAQNNKELSEHQGVTVAAMSRMVDQLVDSGMIQRIPHKSDRRQIVLQLTKLGDQHYRRAREKAVLSVNEKMDALSSAELLEIQNALTVLARSIHKILRGSEASAANVIADLRVAHAVVKRKVNVKRGKNQKTAHEKRKNQSLVESSQV